MSNLKKRKMGELPTIEELNYGEFLIHSSNSQSGTNNRPAYSLTVPVENIKQIRLSSVALPVTYYNVNSSNNNFIFTEDADVFPEDLTLTPGNYTSTEFILELKTQMEAASNGGLIYTITLSLITLKLTISSTLGFSLTSSSSSTITGFGTSASNTTHTGTNVFNLSLSNTLLLRGDFGTKTKRVATVLDNDVYNNVLTSVPINENSGGIVHHQFNKSEFFNVNFTAQDFEFYWTDEQNNVIDFNGGIWSIKVQYIHAIARN